MTTRDCHELPDSTAQVLELIWPFANSALERMAVHGLKVDLGLHQHGILGQFCGAPDAQEQAAQGIIVLRHAIAGDMSGGAPA
jgi:hypothetical protein